MSRLRAVVRAIDRVLSRREFWFLSAVMILGLVFILSQDAF